MEVRGLRVEHEGDPPVVVLRIVGRIDPLDLPFVEEAGKNLISGGEKRFVVDLSETEYISSTGVGLLLYYQHVLSQKGGCLKLTAPFGSVQRTFETTKLDDIFDIHATREEAVAAAQKC